MIRLRPQRGLRRGVVALSLAVGVMFLLLTLLAGYTLSLVSEQRQVEEAWAATQAHYAAEAGLVVLRHSGQSQATGACGAARYEASLSGGEAVSTGEVETSTGHLVRRSLPVRPSSSPGRGTGGEAP